MKKSLILLAAFLFFGFASAQETTVRKTTTTTRKSEHTIKKHKAPDTTTVGRTSIITDSVVPATEPIRAKPGDPQPEKMKRVRVKEQTQTN